MGDITSVYHALKHAEASPKLTYNCTQSPSLQGFHFMLSCQVLFPSMSSSAFTTPHHSQSHDETKLLQNLQALLYLPTSLFFDPYELDQRAAEGYGPPVLQLEGETNLELPIAAASAQAGALLDERGSYALFDLGNGSGSESGWRFEIPVHARYLMPSKEGEKRTHESLKVNWPILFSAEGILSTFFIIVPALHLCSRTIVFCVDLASTEPPATPQRFSPYSASSQAAVFDFQIPIGREQDLGFVEPLTVVAILGCFFYVGRAVLGWGRKEGAKVKTA